MGGRELFVIFLLYVFLETTGLNFFTFFDCM